jgi:hypothetical protein
MAGMGAFVGLVRGKIRRADFSVYLGARHLPRLRLDQLLNFAWKFLVPLALINLLVAAAWWKWPFPARWKSAGCCARAFWPFLSLAGPGLARPVAAASQIYLC